MSPAITKGLTLCERVMGEPGDISTYSDQFAYDISHPAYGKVAAFEWTFDPRYRLAKTGQRRQWIAFHRAERNAWNEEGQPDRFDDMDRAIKDGSIYPIYVVEHKGVGYVWDGNHRVASAVAMGRTTLPAWVGRRIVRENPGTGVIYDQNGCFCSR